MSRFRRIRTTEYSVGPFGFHLLSRIESFEQGEERLLRNSIRLYGLIRGVTTTGRSVAIEFFISHPPDRKAFSGDWPIAPGKKEVNR